MKLFHIPHTCTKLILGLGRWHKNPQSINDCFVGVFPFVDSKSIKSIQKYETNTK